YQEEGHGNPYAETMSQQDIRYRRRQGPLPSWLFEIEDEPQHYQQPILDELEIDFSGIIRKVVWVLIFPMTPRQHQARVLSTLRFPGPRQIETPIPTRDSSELL
ncbi:unnamed protein product, partial [Heterosigma akashiwo]